MIGGFYNWHKVFGEQGSFSLLRAKEGMLEDYDIIFIGMSKPELEGQSATRIRKEIGWKSKTKLVVCIDYAVELWQGTFNPYSLEQELLQADVVFVSEPTMISHVRALMDDKIEVHHLLHPTNVSALQSYYKPKELRSDEIIALIHRYDNNWLAPFLATKELPWNTHVVLLDPQIEKFLHSYFKYIQVGMEFMRYLDWASRKKIILDSYHRIHTYGRSAVDGACLQVPVIGSDWTHVQKMLWPELTVKAGDVFEQKRLIKKLMTDDSFYDDCVEYANEKVEIFSYENRKKEFLDIVYNAKEKNVV
jgi:hypothetical protein